MKRILLYVLLGAMAALFAVVLCLVPGALLEQDRELSQIVQKHNDLEARVDAERRATAQLVEQLAQKTRLLDESLEKVRLRAELVQAFQPTLAGMGGQPDKAEVRKLARLPVAQIVTRLWQAMESGQREKERDLDAALRTKGHEAFTCLVNLISRTRGSYEKYYYLSMLSRLRDPKTLAFFQKLLVNETDKLSRRVAATALMRLPDKSSVPVLIEALRTSNDWGVKTNAAAALGVIKDRRAVEPLKSAYQAERKPLLRNYALAALAHIGDHATVAFFCEIVKNSSNEDHRLIALNGLKKIGTPAALAELRDIATHQTGTVADEARKAVQDLSQKKAAVPE